MATIVVEFRVVVIGLALTLLATGLSQARTPARPIVAGHHLDAEVATLETQVGKDPTNAVLLHALVEAYLVRKAPGLAQAALDHAPAELRQQPSIADQRVRTLTLLGHPQLAFVAQNAALAECSRIECTRELVGRGRHRLEWLRQLLEMDIADPRAEPNRALLAYRLASRQVMLEVH